MMLRPYQQEAHDKAIEHIKKSSSPCVIEAATGAGKSHIIAALAQTIHRISGGKHILVLAPSAELVTQNREKFLQTGSPASVFSASISKCLKHPVVFGTPMSVKNSISKFGSRFACVIIDEAHGITPTVKTIIDTMQGQNPLLRVVGLSATPFRLGDGYIYRMDENGRALSEAETRDPYFSKLVYKITAPYLVEQGYLTRPRIGQICAGNYETKHMRLNAQGKFNKEDIDRAYHGKGRKTSGIVADVIAQSKDRMGVMFFAATIQHAQEILESLPPELSRIVTGETPKAERESVLKQFKAKKIKYLVNVAVLTTGFDAEHVDVIALLRATESVGLLTQIIGRGLRLHDEKKDCLILDYAENIERHCPDGDLFNPQVLARGARSDSVLIDVVCPICGGTNRFSARENKEGLKYTKDGYFADLTGAPLETPSHYGRRCQVIKYDQRNPQGVQCSYRWNGKECPHCGEDNDIAARHCTKCKKEIIDPNEKLRLEFQALKKDPYQTQTDEVLDMKTLPTVSKSGREVFRVEFVTPYRKFTVWIQKNPSNAYQLSHTQSFLMATRGGYTPPQTVTYKKEPNGFYKILGYNKAKDELKTT